MAKQVTTKRVGHLRASRLLRRSADRWEELVGYPPMRAAVVRLEDDVKLPAKGAIKVDNVAMAWPITVTGFEGQAHLVLFGPNRKTDTFAVISSDILTDALLENPVFEVQ